VEDEVGGQMVSGQVRGVRVTRASYVVANWSAAAGVKDATAPVSATAPGTLPKGPDTTRVPPSNVDSSISSEKVARTVVLTTTPEALLAGETSTTVGGTASAGGPVVKVQT
jgi:hypothetical protein